MTAIRRPALLVLPLLGALLAALLGSPAQAGARAAGAVSAGRTAAAAAAQCPAVLPVSAVRSGMRGQGLTVTRGRTPQPFAVEVLGVLPDALAPGRDIILVEVSDLAGRDVIAQGGGIWAGMSGSPVYVGGKLLGAIAFGFTAAPSPIGGVTPAEEMVKLLSLPAGAAAAAEPEPARVAIPRAFQPRLEAAGVPAAAASLERLPMPLGLSGLSPQRLSRFQADAERAGLPVVVHAGGSRAAPTCTTTMARPTAGGNFVAALSYGDLTAAATGTTTAVCGPKALAFGHPFSFIGASGFGANDATALTIVKDDTFGSFKFATIGAPFGTVDQDRLAGIRARLGVRPDTTPVTATITAVDLGRTRTGSTRVTDDRFLPGLTFFSLLSSFDAGFDEIGDGTATTEWAIVGTRAGGVPFQLRRSDRWASQFDVAIEPVFDVAITVDRLLNNPFEKVGIDRVRFTSDVSTVLRQLRVVDALVSVNGGPFTRSDPIEVRPGALLRARVVLQPFQRLSTRTVELSVRVPAGTAGRFGSLQVVGGVPGEGGEVGSACLLADGGCSAGQPRESLDTLLAEIRNRPRHDDLSLVLSLDPADGSGATLTRSTTQRLDQVVVGSRSFAVGVTG